MKHSKLFNFADDTTTDCRGKEAQKIKADLESDAKRLLQFMASNGLVANESKTEFLVLNEKEKLKDHSILKCINVGDATINRTPNTKLLGITIQENQEWTEHFKGLKTSLNQRLFVIRRVMRQIPKSKVLGVVHSLWVSKLRYGLQLCTKVRISDSDVISGHLKALQLTQNRMLRVLNGSKIKDKVSISTMLKKFDLLSVNQLGAKIKLIEVWKTLNKVDYPLSLDSYKPINTNRNHDLRDQSNRVFDDSCKKKKSESSFHVDAARLWNILPQNVRSAPSLELAKKTIDAFCKSLPI